MSNDNQPTVEIEKAVYGGDCLGHLDNPDQLPSAGAKLGKAVFVPLSLPGERVSVRLVEEKRTFAKGEIVELLKSAAGRVEPQCRHFGRCGGCHYQHADYATQLRMKEQVLRETLSRGGVAVPHTLQQLSGDPWRYRNRIRLAVFPDVDGRMQIGYRGRGSHALVPIVECPIAAPALLSAAQSITAFLENNQAPMAFAEMELFTNEDQSQLLVTLFSATGLVNTDVSLDPNLGRNREPGLEPSLATSLDQWLSHLQTASPAISGIRVVAEGGSLNPPVLASCGLSELAYTAGAFGYAVEHGAFFQVNRQVVDALIELVTAGRSGGEAWDLFAGVGLFAQQLSKSFQSVTAVESAPASLVSLKQNLESSHPGSTASAVAATALEFLRRNRQQREPRPDLIVVDPPRAGLGSEVTSLLNAIGAPAMVYVSCDPTTLAKDLLALTRERYRIDRITLVDMFPQTFHIEAVVELSRS